MKNVLKIVGGLLLAFAIILAGLFVLVAAYQYRPAELLEINLPAGWQESPQLIADREYSLLSWSIGYGSRNSSSDNFMEGGYGVRAGRRQTVSKNLEGIYAEIAKSDPDLILLQAVDHESKRSYNFKEDEILGEALGFGVYTPNHKAFIPKPWPVSGRTDAGLAGFSKLKVTSAVRQQLPENYSWPEKMYSISHCLEILRLPVENSDAELVLINLDLKTYATDAETLAKQMEVFFEIITAERDQGNYVIAGGDFGQTLLPFSDLSYKSENPHWEPGNLDTASIPTGFKLLYGNPDIPTRRLNDKPYDSEAADTICFLTDAFIVSDEIAVKSCESFELDFEFSDHNPLLLKFSLDRH
ncbi:MAG: endonuclease/exonuclease/phosphatase family protein [Clostridiaceae bacterium]|nr:endonuclease/exonuclease/phosphatase family protein [Clostridiaceae bacterium]